MNIGNKKQKYVPCELKTVEFEVEQGFANSFIGTDTDSNRFLDFLMFRNAEAGNENEQFDDPTWASGSDAW